MTHTSPTVDADRTAVTDPVISMSGIARLARVRRPVVTTWRRRKATGPDPFPAPVNPGADQLRFNAGEVAAWLARTGLGNNPTVSEDVTGYTSADLPTTEA